MIERDIPIPPRTQYGFAQLQPGESLLKKCADKKERFLARKAAYRIGAYKNWKITVRTVPEGIRVWRIA